MASPSLESSADPDRLAAALPPASGDWIRDDDDGGIVEYRLPADEGVCHAAKLVVRPELFADAAVRIDRTKGCRGAGTTRHDDVDEAAEAVAAALAGAAAD